jgi:hypothetical protein
MARFVFAALVACAALPPAAAGERPPTADDPRFDDKTHWPGLTGKEHYVSQQWPKGPVLVYGGMDAQGMKTGGSGWVDLATGKRTSKGPDADTDVILPPADKPYEYGRRGGTYRHVTVGRNAYLKGGGDRSPMHIHGNIWIKKGGKMRAQGATVIAGGRHTFYRNDNRCTEWNAPDWWNVSTSMYINFRKTDGATAEVVGQVAMNDEFSIRGCTVIVAPDSKLQPGRNGHPKITDGGRLVLLDGAYFGVWTNNYNTTDLTVEGTIQGGLPERPLKRDARVGIATKNYNKVMYEGRGGPGKVETTRVVGLLLKAGSTLKTVSTDAEKARLVVGLSRDNWGWRIREQPGSAYEKKTLRKDPDAKYRYAWYDKLPKLIDVWFGKGVTVEGVTFDAVRKGGLMLAEPADRKKWKDVGFGAKCEAQGDELFSELKEIGRKGEY